MAVDEIWEMPHPGTGEIITCATFEEAMQKYFEGWNVPRLRMQDGRGEDFEIAYKRVDEYLQNKRQKE